MKRKIQTRNSPRWRTRRDCVEDLSLVFLGKGRRSFCVAVVDTPKMRTDVNKDYIVWRWSFGHKTMGATEEMTRCYGGAGLTNVPFTWMVRKNDAKWCTISAFPLAIAASARPRIQIPSYKPCTLGRCMVCTREFG